MSMTLDQIVEEARRLAPEQVMELVDRLTRDLDMAPEVEQPWKNEIRRRLAEVESGDAEGIPGEEVSAHVRRLVRG